LDLFADRPGTHTLRANRIRLYFSSFAYVLLCDAPPGAKRRRAGPRAKRHDSREAAEDRRAGARERAALPHRPL
jgi:hypothetical protein